MNMLSDSIQYRLRFQHQTLFELVEGKDLSRRPEPSKWSAFEQLVHLAAYQPVFLKRVQLILNTENPGFERYVAEQDPLFHEYIKKDLTGLLSIVSELRADICSELLGLDPEQLSRTGIHPRYGLMDITGWTEFFLLHEAHHLFAIFSLTRGPE
jgi:hypothetical protein